MKTEHWIDIVSTLVNAGLGLWIAKSLQNNQTNKRILKDHFIEEIKQLRDDYRLFFANIDTMDSKQFIPWFKLMTIRINDLTASIGDRYGISSDQLDPYKIHLNRIITNLPEYTFQYNIGGPIVFTAISKNHLLRFQQSNFSIFNSMIISINNC